MSDVRSLADYAWMQLCSYVSPISPFSIFYTQTNNIATPISLTKQTVTTAIMGGESFKKEKLKSSYPTRAAHPVGQMIPDIYKERMDMFYSGGQYESKNLRAYTTPITTCH
jgi:hypothetical protein